MKVTLELSVISDEGDEFHVKRDKKVDVRFPQSGTCTSAAHFLSVLLDKYERELEYLKYACNEERRLEWEGG